MYNSMKIKILYTSIWILLSSTNLTLPSQECQPSFVNSILIIDDAHISISNEVILTTKAGSMLEITNKNTEDLKLTPNGSAATCIYTHYEESRYYFCISDSISLACILLPSVI